MTDHWRRVELLAELWSARSTIREAIARVHAVDISDVNERTGLARRQLDDVAAAVRALP